MAAAEVFADVKAAYERPCQRFPENPAHRDIPWPLNSSW